MNVPETSLRVVAALADQLVARGLLSSTSIEIETIRYLVRDYREARRDEAVRQLAEEILARADQTAKTDTRGLLLARVVLGDLAALDTVLPRSP